MSKSKSDKHMFSCVLDAAVKLLCYAEDKNLQQTQIEVIWKNALKLAKFAKETLDEVENE